MAKTRSLFPNRHVEETRPLRPSIKAADSLCVRQRSQGALGYVGPTTTGCNIWRKAPEFPNKLRNTRKDGKKIAITRVLAKIPRTIAFFVGGTMYSSSIKTAVAIVGMAITPFMGHAAVLSPGVYEAFDIAYVPPEPSERSIWTNPNPSSTMVTGGSASNLWSFVNAIFNYVGTNATLSGSAVNTGDAALTFDFEFNFNNAVNGPITSTGPGTDSGYCQFDGSPGICNAGDGFGTEQWTYFNFLSGSATGTGVMDGLTYTFSDVGGIHPPQAGLEANALVNNGFLGFSMWFGWTLDGGPVSNKMVNGDTYSFNASGNGDINTNLAPIPVPAAGLLLVSAFGGLAAVRRRRQKAA